MSAVTTGIKPVKIGQGRNKSTVYTGTKVTPTTDSSGNKTYKVEIIQYDNANGDGGRVIGERDSTNSNKINWNDNASGKIKQNQNKISKESKSAVSTIQPQLTSNSSDKSTLNNSNGSKNKGKESDNSQDEPRLSNVSQAADTLNAGAGKAAAGTRESGFGSYVFPRSLRQGRDGQDFLKFDMLKYEPRDFDDKSFSFKKRTDTNKRTIGTVILLSLIHI